MTRNGKPPWPDYDDIDHEFCAHDVINALMPMLSTGSVECPDCGHVVTVEDLG